MVVFYFDIWDLDTDTGVRPAAKRRNNAVLPLGKFCKGVKSKRNNPEPHNHTTKKAIKPGKIDKFLHIFYTTDTQMFTR